MHIVAIAAVFSATVACSGGSGDSGGKQRPAAGEETLVDAVADITLLPAPLPALAPEQRYEYYEYIRKVTSGDPDGLAALIALVQAAGITIIDSNAPGIVIEPTGPSMGLGVEAAGLHAAFTLEQQQWSVELTDLADVLVTNLELPTTAGELSAMILADLERAAGLPEPVGTWSQTIKSLGLVDFARSDLGDGLLPFYGAPSSPLEPTNVRIGATQTLLIMARLGAELHVAAGADPAAAPVTSSPGRPSVVHPTRAAQPCTLGSTESTILDGAALGVTYGFSQVLELVGEAVPSAKRYGEFLSKAAIVTTIMKFLWTTYAFETKIELVDGPPLVRTTDRTAGDNRTVKATFTMNIGKAAWMNCARFLLNGAGLDFNLPNDGALSGNSVKWTLAEGRDVVALCRQGCGGTGSVIEGTTADDGTATNIVQGNPHRRAVDKRLKVTRHATVRADIALKDPQLIQDLIDAFSAATAGPGAIVVFTTEQLYRLHIWGASTRFEVTDHVAQLVFDVKVEGSMRTESSVDFRSGDGGPCTVVMKGTTSFSMQFSTGTERFEIGAANMVKLLEGDPATGTLRLDATVNANAANNVDTSGSTSCADGGSGGGPAPDCGAKSGELPLVLAMQVASGELRLFPGANPRGGIGTEQPWMIYERCTNASDLLGQVAGKLAPEQLLGEEPFTVVVETTLRGTPNETTEVRWKVTFTPILEQQP